MKVFKVGFVVFPFRLKGQKSSRFKSNESPTTELVRQSEKQIGRRVTKKDPTRFGE